MAKCEICGKGPQFGHNISHSMRATNRQWKPNIQRVIIIENGRPKRVYICAKCLKARAKSK